jgi:hypothetical protein
MVLRVTLCLVLALSTACMRIEDPWVRDATRLTDERARDPATARALSHRLAAVQAAR